MCPMSLGEVLEYSKQCNFVKERNKWPKLFKASSEFRIKCMNACQLMMKRMSDDNSMMKQKNWTRKQTSTIILSLQETLMDISCIQKEMRTIHVHTTLSMTCVKVFSETLMLFTTMSHHITWSSTDV